VGIDMSDKRAIKKAVELLRKHGRGGDTILAHINPKEAEALKAMGGSGQPNPTTGLPEFLNIRDEGGNLVSSGGAISKEMLDIEEKALDAETQRYIDEQKARAEQDRIAFENEQRTYAAQAEAQRLADQEAFTKAQAEIEAIAQKERDVITRQAAEYDAQQKRLQEEAAAEALRLKAEQAALEQQRVEAQQQAALVKEKARTEFEGVQREGAEREAGRKRAARSATARPLLMGAAPTGSTSELGARGTMGTSSTLGSTQTLGVG
jgi:membrane protein involved in colicin uptake